VRGDYLKIVDPHISSETIFPFTGIIKKNVKEIKILTSKIYDEEKLIGYLKKLEKESKVKINIKINQRGHDRLLISKNSCWSIGTSIKDLGNKDSIIKEIIEIKDSLEGLFDDRWRESKSIVYP